MADRLIRLVKGALVGIGFILPGLSGGVLAVIIGIYDKLIRCRPQLRECPAILWILFMAGTIASYLFSKVDEKYPREELF